MTAGDPDWVRQAWLKSLRFELPSVLAERDDLPTIRNDILLARTDRAARLDELTGTMATLGTKPIDKAVAFGGLTCAALGGLGLLAGGPVTWLVAAAIGGTLGGAGLTVLGGVRMSRHNAELERLEQRQRWLTLEIESFKRAQDRIMQAIEIRVALS